MSDQKYPIAVVIEAIDKLTGPMRAMSGSIAAATQPVRSLHDGFKGLSNETGSSFSKNLNSLGRQGRDLVDWTSLLAHESGLPKVVHAMSGVGKAASEVGSAVKEAGLAFLELGVAGYSLERVVEGFAEYGDHAARLSQQLGVSVTGYQELSYAAKLADIDQEQFDKGLQKLSTNMVDAARGTGAALPVFRALGVSVTGAGGKLKTLEQILPQLADKLHGVANANVRAAIVQELFGAKNAQLVGFLSKGSHGLKEYAEEARKLGLVLDEDGIKKAEEFHDMTKRLGAVFQGVQNTLGAALTPALVKLGETLQESVINNREAIQAFAEGLAEQLPGIVEVLVQGLKALFDVAKICAQGFQWLSGVIGPTNAAFLLIAGTIGRGVTLAVAELTIAVGELALAFLLTPFGLITAGIALVGFAGYELIKHWQQVKDFFSEFWTWMEVKTHGLIDVFAGLVVGGPLGALLSAGRMLMSATGAASAASGPASSPDAGKGLGSGFAGANSTNTQNANVSVMFHNPPAGTKIKGTSESGLGLDLYSGPLLVGN